MTEQEVIKQLTELVEAQRIEIERLQENANRYLAVRDHALEQYSWIVETPSYEWDYNIDYMRKELKLP